MNRDHQSVYLLSLSNQLDKHNRVPIPPAPELRQTFDLLLGIYRQRGCTFTFTDIEWDGKTVPGVVMAGSIVPEDLWNDVLDVDNPWRLKNESKG